MTTATVLAIAIAWVIVIGALGAAVALSLAIEKARQRRERRDQDVLGIADTVGVLRDRTATSYDELDQARARRVRQGGAR